MSAVARVRGCDRDGANEGRWCVGYGAGTRLVGQCRQCTAGAECTADTVITSKYSAHRSRLRPALLGVVHYGGKSYGAPDGLEPPIFRAKKSDAYFSIRPDLNRWHKPRKSH